MFDTFSPWLVLAGLGAYHGINPGMGWLFGVALGMQEKRRYAVIKSLLPMALGHAISIAVVVIVVTLAQVIVPKNVLKIICAVVLFTFGLYKFFRSRHPKWVGMRVNFRDLTAWSFLMATAHGAGLMLTPIVLKLNTDICGLSALSPQSLVNTPGTMMSAVGIHTMSFFFVMGTVAVLVYEKFGLTLLRTAWFNLDLFWAIALMVAGGVALAM